MILWQQTLVALVNRKVPGYIVCVVKQFGRQVNRSGKAAGVVSKQITFRIQNSWFRESALRKIIFNGVLQLWLLAKLMLICFTDDTFDRIPLK